MTTLTGTLRPDGLVDLLYQAGNPAPARQAELPYFGQAGMVNLDTRIAQLLEAGSGEEAAKILESRKALTILELQFLAKAYMIWAHRIDHTYPSFISRKKVSTLYAKAASVARLHASQEVAAQLGDYYYRVQEFDNAEFWYRKLDQYSASSLRLASVLLDRQRQGDAEECIGICANALAASQVIAYSMQADSLQRQRKSVGYNYELSKAASDAAERLGKERDILSRLCLIQAKAHEQLGDITAAAASYQRALEIKPECWEAKMQAKYV